MVLIGGGEVGRGNTSYETKEIDEEIVKMTEKESPNFLFIGLASSFSDSYYDTMKKIYKELGCNCMYLKKKNILNNPSIVEDKILSADIIYICGGDTVKLLDDVKTYHIDTLLEQALNQGTVLAGMSAGALLLSQKGFSDSLILRGESEKNEFLEGLGFASLNFCPHYEEGSVKDKELQECLEGTTDAVYCLENCTALKVIDDRITLIKSNQERNGYLLTCDKKEVLT